jgi:hypothetical protein
MSSGERHLLGSGQSPGTRVHGGTDGVRAGAVQAHDPRAGEQPREGRGGVRGRGGDLAPPALAVPDEEGGKHARGQGTSGGLGQPGRPSTARQAAAAWSHSARIPVPAVQARSGYLASSALSRSSPACG